MSSTPFLPRDISRRHSVSDGGATRPSMRRRAYSVSDAGLTPTTEPIVVSCMEKLVKIPNSSANVFLAGSIVGLVVSKIEQCVRHAMESREEGVDMVGSFHVKSQLKSYLDRLPAAEQVVDVDQLVAAMGRLVRLLKEVFARTFSAEDEADWLFAKLVCMHRFVDNVRRLVDVEGFIAYRRTVHENRCDCSLCQEGKPRWPGVLVPYRADSESHLDDDTAMCWPTRVVFTAGMLSTRVVFGNPSEGDILNGTVEISDVPGMLTFRSIHAHDIGIPVRTKVPEPCDICKDAPKSPNFLLRTRTCGHKACAACLQTWAEQIPDVGVWHVTCPYCRSELQAPGFPHSYFCVTDLPSMTRLVATYWYYENCGPSHPYFGLHNGWEEDAVQWWTSLLCSNNAWKNVGLEWDGVMLALRRGDHPDSGVGSYLAGDDLEDANSDVESHHEVDDSEDAESHHEEGDSDDDNRSAESHHEEDDSENTNRSAESHHEEGDSEETNPSTESHDPEDDWEDVDSDAESRNAEDSGYILNEVPVTCQIIDRDGTVLTYGPAAEGEDISGAIARVAITHEDGGRIIFTVP